MRALQIPFFLIILSTLFVVSCQKKGTPSDVIKYSLKCLKENNVEGLLSTFECKPEEKELLKELFTTKMQKNIEQRNGIASYEIIGEDIIADGKEAVVKAIITYGDKENEEIDFNLSLVDGRWKQVVKK